MSEEKSTEKERKRERKLVELSSTSSSDDVRYSSVSLSSCKSVIKEEIRNLGGEREQKNQTRKSVHQNLSHMKRRKAQILFRLSVEIKDTIGGEMKLVQ